MENLKRIGGHKKNKNEKRKKEGLVRKGGYYPERL
jgi:hypothetical protein